MKVEKLIQRILGKKDFKLSSDIPFSYIFFKGISYFVGLLRGMICGVGMKEKGNYLFIDKKVKIFNKSNIKIGNHVRIEQGVLIDALSTEGVSMGNKVKLGKHSTIVCSGLLSDLGKGIIIGDNTSFAENTFFGAAGGIRIGSDVIAGQNVRFHSENHKFNNKDELIRLQGVERQGISIGNNVWIGSGVVFLDGSEVEDGCVIAANAVVNKKFAKNTVIGGIPARTLKRR